GGRSVPGCLRSRCFSLFFLTSLCLCVSVVQTVCEESPRVIVPMRSEPVPLPPVLILGGDANALSVPRCLGRRGGRVFTLNDHEAPVRHSRYCRLLPVPWLGSIEASWAGFLLGPDAEWLRGAVLLACCDEALEVIAHNRARLAERFLLDESNPDAQL